jgi:hypothetical protein
MIGVMFSGRHALPKDETGNFFIDRDGSHFHHILNFLCCPEEWIFTEVNQADLVRLRIEAQYCGLKEEMFGKKEQQGLKNVTSYSGNVYLALSFDNGIWYVNYNNGGDMIMSCCRGCVIGWHPSYPQYYFYTTYIDVPAAQQKTGRCPSCRAY